MKQRNGRWESHSCFLYFEEGTAEALFSGCSVYLFFNFTFNLTCFYKLHIDKCTYLKIPGGSDGKESACNAGDPASSLGSGRSPGEGNATHSSILAQRIPWIEEPGRLQSMGLQRDGHD